MSTWIFGYGSLIYKPGFPYRTSKNGYINNYRRVFHQGSTDHRGTPEAPGRTVTLEPLTGAKTWGVAYELDGDEQQQKETLKYLEWREKQYDVREYVDLYSAVGDTAPAVSGVLVYIATENPLTNVNYLGPAPVEQIADQIAHAHGPSGPNYEYLYRLADALREMGVEDQHVFELEDRVKEIRATMKLEEGSAASISATSAAVSAQ